MRASAKIIVRGLLYMMTSLVGLGVHATDGFNARAGVYRQNADTYDGSVTTLGLGYAAGGYRLGLNTDLARRTYAGGAGLRDDQFGIAGSVKASDHGYVEAIATAGATADIYARWGAIVVPHYVVNKNDFGLGFRYADYRTGRAGGINPNYLHYFANGLAVGGGAYVIRTDSYITSYTAQALYTYAERHGVRVVGAGGRVLEDRGLEAQFNSLSVEYAYTCRAGFTAAVGLTDYWSEIRRERVLGFRIGWR